MKIRSTQKLFKKGILSLCFFQMAFGPAIVIAQEAPVAAGPTTSQRVLETAVELTKMGVGLYNQNLMQQAMIAQMQNNSRQFTPPLAPQGLVSQCNMPQRPEPMPVQCDPPIGEVNPAQAAASMASVCNAEKALNFLNGALPDGQAASTVTCPNPMNGMPMSTATGILPGSNYGLRCMDNFRENLALQIQNGVLNDLKKIKSQLEQELGRAREVNNKIMRDIEDVSGELNGNQNPDSGVDIAQYFDGDAACQLAMDKGLMSKINGAGLRGVEKMFLEPRGQKQIPISSAAGDYITNRDAIKKDLRKTITTMSEIISDRGPDGLIESLEKNKGAGVKLDINSTQFAGLQQRIGQSIGFYKAEKERVTEKFSELGFQAPDLTEDFDISSEELLNSSRFMDNCFNGGTSGTSMSLDQIRFKTKDGFSGGTIEGRVKKRLDEILSNQEMRIDDKLNEIRSLDQTIMRKGNEPILQVSIDIDGSPKNISVSDFYKFQQKNCEKKFNTSQEAENFKEARDLLQNLKKVGSSFQNDFSDLAKEIENCNGASLRKNPNACADGSALDPASPAFCMDTADRCANSITSCMKKAKTIVKQKEAQRQDLANRFNANMQNLQAIYDTQIIALNNVVGGFQKSLGGFTKVAEVIPEMNRIGVLKMERSPFGVELIDGGSFDRFEQEVPQAIDSMMVAVEQQGQAINDKINEEAQNKELPRIQALIAEFEQIKQSCQAVYQKMQQDIAEKQKEQQEQIQKASEVCAKARNLFAPSVKPGCETLKGLAGEMHEIANVLTPNAMGFANGLSNFCDREDSADAPEGSDEIGALAKACSRGGAKKELEELKKKFLGSSTYNAKVKADPTFADSPQGRAAENIEAALQALEKQESEGTSRTQPKSDHAQAKDSIDAVVQAHEALEASIKVCNKKYAEKLKEDVKYNDFNTSTERAGWIKRFNQINENCSVDMSSISITSKASKYSLENLTPNTLMTDFTKDSDAGTDGDQPCKGLARAQREECQTSVANLLIDLNQQCGNAGIPQRDDATAAPDFTGENYDYCNEFQEEGGESPSELLPKYNAAKTAYEQHPEAQDEKDPVGSGGPICEQLSTEAKKLAETACEKKIIDTSDGDIKPRTESIEGCNSAAKEAEFMNNPQGFTFKLIEQAIKQGRQVAGDGSSSPFLNAMGENLAGQCHMGEIPNRGDVANPLAPAQQTPQIIKKAIEL